MGAMADQYFRHKSTGKIDKLPAHYAHHPVFGKNLEPVDGPDDYCAPCGQPEQEPVSEPDTGQGEVGFDFYEIDTQEVGYDD